MNRAAINDKVHKILQEKGIIVSKNWLECYFQVASSGPDYRSNDLLQCANDLFNLFLNTDLCICREKRILPDGIENLHLQRLFLDKIVILQIDDSINISSSLASRKETNGEKIMGSSNKLVLTDGFIRIFALDIDGILNGRIFNAGCKIAVKNTLVRRGALILDNSCSCLLGGKVPSLCADETAPLISIKSTIASEPKDLKSNQSSLPIDNAGLQFVDTQAKSSNKDRDIYIDNHAKREAISSSVFSDSSKLSEKSSTKVQHIVSTSALPVKAFENLSAPSREIIEIFDDTAPSISYDSDNQEFEKQFQHHQEAIDYFEEEDFQYHDDNDSFTILKQGKSPLKIVSPKSDDLDLAEFESEKSNSMFIATIKAPTIPADQSFDSTVDDFSLCYISDVLANSQDMKKKFLVRGFIKRLFRFNMPLLQGTTDEYFFDVRVEFDDGLNSVTAILDSKLCEKHLGRKAFDISNISSRRLIKDPQVMNMMKQLESFHGIFWVSRVSSTAVGSIIDRNRFLFLQDYISTSDTKKVLQNMKNRA